LPYTQQIDSETVIKFWFATFYEEPETAKNSIAKVLQEVYDAATIEKHPLEFLFNGSRDSPIYTQFLAAYKIHKYVQNNKVFHLSKYELLAYADEMMCYGIYKNIGTNLDDYDNSKKLETAYLDSVSIIDSLIQKNKREIEGIGKTFSFNGYFKKPKCRVDFNEAKSIIESDTLIDDLKIIR
jgi:hypothetical protein